MSQFQDILFEKHHRVQGAAWITINRPDSMNSFTGDTLTEIRQAVDDCCADPEVGVILVDVDPHAAGLQPLLSNPSDKASPAKAASTAPDETVVPAPRPAGTVE